MQMMMNSITASRTNDNRLPSTVELKTLKYRHYDGTTASGSTCATYTSPFSAQPISPLEPATLYYDSRRKHRQTYSISQYKASARLLTDEKRVKGIASRHSTKHHQTHHTHNHNDTLTWRMDPNNSLSDFTLTVTGIDDKESIDAYMNTKKKRRLEKKKQWMGEKLYLDRNISDDIECRNTANDKDSHSSQEYRIGPHTKATKVVETYHLHRASLAIGPKSCDYFTRLFQMNDTVSSLSSNNNNHHHHHSIEVPMSCLPAIPAMLDYIYDPNPNTNVHATTATAVQLRYLATLLGNHELFDSATQFLRMDLRPETAVEYLQLADLYQQHKLLEVCIRICAENFDQLKITWLAGLLPHFIKRILYSRYFITRSTTMHTSEVLSSKIASYCRCQLQNIDRKAFLSLTNVKVMPVICSTEALFYIQAMTRLGMDSNNLSDNKVKSLYDRCIVAAPMVMLSAVGSSACQSSNGTGQVKNSNHQYEQLPTHIKVDLLEYALSKRLQN